MGQLNGTITIGTKTWTVRAARTISEMHSGLGNLPSIPSQTGMLFDIGGQPGVAAYAGVALESMLFPLDIVAIQEVANQGSDGKWSVSARTVTAVFHNVDNESTWDRQIDNVRYFLEVTGGEANDVNIGDAVAFDTTMSNVLLGGPAPLDMGDLMNMMISMMVVVMMMKMMAGAFSSKELV